MIIKKLCKEVEHSPSFSRINLFIRLFKHAIKGDQDIQQDQSKFQKYFQQPEHYSLVIQYALLKLPQAINVFYSVDYASTLRFKDISLHIHQVLIRGFIIKALRYLEYLLDASDSDQQQLLFIVNALASLNFINTAFDSLLKKALKLLLQIWSDQLNLQVKLAAFLQIRKLFHKLPDYQQADVLKKFYDRYLVAVKHVVWRNYESVTFMQNCFVELCNLNMNQAYQVMFHSLQKFVKRLRDANKAKTQENIAALNNQQTIFLLRLWVQAICIHSQPQQLADLMPPLVQIIQSVLEFQPSIENYPFQLQLTQMLVKIAQTFQVHISVVPHYLEMLSCVDLKRRKLKISVKPFDFVVGIILKPKHRQSGQFWSEFCQLILDQLTVYLSNFSKAQWFPSYTLSMEKQLKRLCNQLGFVGNKMKVKEFIKLIEENKTAEGESRLRSKAEQLQFEWDEMIKQKVLAEKEREEKGEELDESQQEIDDEKEREYALNEILKYKEEKKKEQEEEIDYDNMSEYEGDPDLVNEDEDEAEDFADQDEMD